MLQSNISHPSAINSRGAGDASDRARMVAEVAAAHAEAVDQNAVFPQSAIDAAKAAQLLSLSIPIELGGEGATISDVAEVCYILGQACASTAMIVAMHHAALACVIRHRGGSSWHDKLLRRVAADNLLMASSTTEGQTGGNTRVSASPLVYANDRVSLDRDATVISYGREADGIVTTARRSDDDAASRQSLVAFLKEDYSLTPTNRWDTLGMRGTCSAGFSLKASAASEQVLPVEYAEIHSFSMVPVSHLLWSSAWIGIAAGAVSRAQSFLRQTARRAEGQLPPGAANYTKAVRSLRALRGRLATALAEFEAMADDRSRLTSIESQAALNLLKVDISEGALDTVALAMRTCGLAGYRNDGPFSCGRHLRDILSAPIMIHNDRILASAAGATLLSSIPTSLRTV